MRMGCWIGRFRACWKRCGVDSGVLAVVRMKMMIGLVSCGRRDVKS
jgi:hypothetical protein